jgi:hypothetical protein
MTIEPGLISESRLGDSAPVGLRYLEDVAELTSDRAHPGCFDHPQHPWRPVEPWWTKQEGTKGGDVFDSLLGGFDLVKECPIAGEELTLLMPVGMIPEFVS